MGRGAKREWQKMPAQKQPWQPNLQRKHQTKVAQVVTNNLSTLRERESKLG